MFYFAPTMPPAAGDPLVRHYVRKRTFSTADRILVHLSAEALQPGEQTQDGIAATTRSGRSTLTKWLDRLEARGLVARDRIRLAGHPLPKYAYRLTEAGWQAATSLRQRLGSELVTVRAPNLGALSVRLTDVPSLAATRLDLTGTVAAVRKGQLDLAKSSSASRRRGPLVWGAGLRRVDRFFGRADELRDLNAWWASDSQTLVVTGLAGIGKSALVAAWVQGRRMDAPVYGFETRRSSTAAGFLSDFGAFLAALGKPGLAAHLAQGIPLDPAFVSRLLDRDLGRERVLVIVDNADQARRDLARLIGSLFLGDRHAFRARLILLGRRFPPWAAAGVAPSTLESRRLQGLDPGASRALLQSRGLGPDASFADEIIRKTRGHPLLLHLAASTGTGHGAVVQRYLQEEVWGALAAKERSVLETVSVFRTAVSEHVLEKVAGTDHRTLSSLAERSLLERTLGGGYLMHDLVREFVGARLPEPRSRRIHARAANVLLRQTDSRDRWEGIYHLLEAGQVTEAASLLDSNEPPLLDCVGAEEIASLVHGLTLDETEARLYCVFAEIVGDSLRIRGHVGPALFQYGHAQRLAESAGKPERIPRLLRKQAFLERCRNRYAKALGCLVEAQARLPEGRNSREMAEILREMGLAEQALGNLRQAAEHLNQAADLATDASDRAALCRTLLALGSLQARQGHLEDGLQTNLEGLRAAEHSGNLTELSHSHIVVGTTFAEMGRLDEALRHYAKGNEIAQLLGNLRLTAYAALNRTAALIEIGRLDDAGRALREAEGYFGILEERDSLALLKTYAGQMQMALGHWARARQTWEEGLAELRTFGSPADLAVALKQAGEFYIRHGEIQEGKAHVVEARTLSRKVGNSALAQEADAILGRLNGAPTPIRTD